MHILTKSLHPVLCACGNVARYLNARAELCCAICPIKEKIDSIRLSDVERLVEWARNAASFDISHAHFPKYNAHLYHALCQWVLTQTEEDVVDLDMRHLYDRQGVAHLLSLAREYLRGPSEVSYAGEYGKVPGVEMLEYSYLREIIGKDVSQ